MKFMMIVKSAERSGRPPQALMEAIDKLGQEAVKAGTMVASGGLAPTAVSTRVRLSGGQLTKVDGPFTEAKEVIGGYAVFELKSKEEAVEWAKRCPASDNEVIEVRQVQEFSDFPADVQKAAAGFPEMQEQSKQRQGS